MLDSPPSAAAAPARLDLLARQHRTGGLALLGVALAGWMFLLWLALDMDTPIAQLAMPMSARWSAANVAAVLAMWAVMMVAMMLPASWPMLLTFSALARDRQGLGRALAFAAAYVLIWVGFAAAGTLGQWGMQALGWVDPIGAGTSVRINAALLLLAGLYQFTPLKRACLRTCRSPVAFLLGGWRSGTPGAFAMGLRHGMLCLGCCWALMVLLFVGGVMNVAWVAALAIAVATEKLVPAGERV
ncbi:MAG: DUF2182 domain-containing protein, partial [Ramlibacter sp.]